MVYGTYNYGILITIVNGVYKPTNITGGPHIVSPSEYDVCLSHKPNSSRSYIFV